MASTQMIGRQLATSVGKRQHEDPDQPGKASRLGYRGHVARQKASAPPGRRPGAQKWNGTVATLKPRPTIKSPIRPAGPRYEGARCW